MTDANKMNGNTAFLEEMENVVAPKTILKEDS